MNSNLERAKEILLRVAFRTELLEDYGLEDEYLSYNIDEATEEKWFNEEVNKIFIGLQNSNDAISCINKVFAYAIKMDTNQLIFILNLFPNVECGEFLLNKLFAYRALIISLKRNLSDQSERLKYYNFILKSLQDFEEGSYSNYVRKILIPELEGLKRDHRR